MPNYIKYSTTAQTLALKSGDFYIGTGDVNKGPTPSTGYWTARTPPTSGYTVYQNINTTPSIYVCNNDTDLINITNVIAGQSYTSVTQCLVYYLGQNDKMCLNIPYPEIVTNGLVLNLDAGFVPSYPRSGTTWSDLSVNGNNGTLINGPTYSSDGGGSIVFDGTNDYVNCGNSSLFNQSGGKSFTITCWALFNSTPAAHNPIFNKAATYGTFEYTLGLNSSRGVQWFTSSNGTSWVSTGVGENIVLSVWYYYAVGYDFTNQVAFSSINGKTIFTSSQTGIFNGNRNFEIGRHNDPTTTMNGRIASLNLYNKVLTAAEILQNYNATKSRFPSIVTNGLVLNLDAGNTASYPGSGTVWTDLSGNGNNATMFGSVPFQTDVAPCFDFASATGTNASTSSLGFTFGSNMIPTTGNFTLSCWVKNPNAPSSQVGLFSNSIDGTGYRFGVYQSGIYWLIGPNYSEGNILFSSAISSSLWYNVVAVFSRTTARVFMYVNGSYQNQASTPASQTAFNNNLVPGLVRSACCDIYKGKLGIFSAYNRALTAEEIAQNYNAQKLRFGL